MSTLMHKIIILFFREEIWTLSHVVSCGLISSHVVTCGHMWSHLVSSRLMWSHVVTYGLISSHVVSCGHIWSHLVSSRLMWSHLLSFVVSRGLIPSHVLSLIWTTPWLLHMTPSKFEWWFSALMSTLGHKRVIIFPFQNRVMSDWSDVNIRSQNHPHFWLLLW